MEVEYKIGIKFLVSSFIRPISIKDIEIFEGRYVIGKIWWYPEFKYKALVEEDLGEYALISFSEANEKIITFENRKFKIHKPLIQKIRK